LWQKFCLFIIIIRYRYRYNWYWLPETISITRPATYHHERTINQHRYKN
jgi:hypothetical protein